MADPVTAAFAAIASAVTSATVAVTGSAALAAALGNAVIATGAFLTSYNGVLLAANLAASVLLAPDVNREGSPTEWRPDPDAGIPYVMGRAGFAGRIIHMDEHGENNRYLSTVSVLSVGPINGEEKLTADRVDVAFGAGTVATSPTEYASKMWRVTALGATDQSTAISTPTLAKNTPALAGWDANSILPGLAHVVWTLVQDSKSKSYPTGAPAPVWTIQGVKLYDPRLDSTYPGGSGSHRIDDPDTWEYTRNPGLHALAWALGRRITDPNTGDELLVGIGASASGVHFPAFVELANVCDTNGWEVAAVASSRDDKHQVLKAILQAGGARYDSFGGKISCVARTPRTPVVTISAADTAGPFEIDVNADRLTRRNTIVPRCVQEDHEWQITPQPVVTDASYVTADGGEIRQSLDFPYVAVSTGSANKDQPAELAAYALLDSRESIAGTVPLKPHMAQVEPGDVFTITEPGFLLDGVDLICVRRTIDPGSNIVTISFISESDGKHTYALGKSQTPPTPPGLSAPDYRTVAAPDEGVFTATAGTDRQPSINVAVSGADEAHRGFIIEQRTELDPDTGSAWASDSDGWDTVGQYDIETEAVAINGLEPTTSYEVAARYVSEFGIAGTRRILDAVTTGELTATGLGDRLASEYVADLESLADALLRSGAGWSQRQLAVASRLGENAAAVVSETEARTTLTDAFASNFTLLGATTGGGSAWVLNEATVQSGARGTLASLFNGISVTQGDHTTDISLLFSAVGTQEARVALEIDVNGLITGLEIDGITQEFIVKASEFKIQALTSGGDPWVPFSVDGTSGAAQFGDTIDLIPAEKLIRIEGVDVAARALSLGASFGTDDLLFWSGPKTVDPGDETKANATVWIDALGNAHFGGTIAARYYEQVAGSFTAVSPVPDLVTSGYTEFASLTISDVEPDGVLSVSAVFTAIGENVGTEQSPSYENALIAWKLTAERDGGGGEITLATGETVAITDTWSLSGTGFVAPREQYAAYQDANPFDAGDLPDDVEVKLYLKRLDGNAEAFPVVQRFTAARYT